MEKLLRTEFYHSPRDIGRLGEHAKKTLFERIGAGSEMTEWLEWPEKYLESYEYGALKIAAQEIRNRDDAVVVIGIGGSYLGAKAVIEAEKGQYHNEITRNPRIYFAGSDLSPDELNDIRRCLELTIFSIIYISKSGGTIEPALSFRYFYNMLKEEYGEDEANERVIAITGQKGILHDLAEKNEWQTFDVPEGIGGRYSVFSPVGLLPIAIAGVDTDELLKGAIEAMKPEGVQQAVNYAVFRGQMDIYAGCKVEFLAVNSKRLQYFGEWYKQLFAESEGKNGKGIFPTSGIFPTDLHSVGQYLQDGTRNLIFETQIIREFKNNICIPEGDSDDGLNKYLGKTINDAADAAMTGAAIAHENGCMPVGKIYVDSSTKALGYLLQFMMTACPISGYMININPFDQPGVEQHKAAMKEILSKK